MTQCPDAHLFCVDCVTHYASTLLGEHNPAIACMDQSGCKLLFTPSALRQILSPKLLALYERVSQRKELEAAGVVVTAGRRGTVIAEDAPATEAAAVVAALRQAAALAHGAGWDRARWEQEAGQAWG